MSKAKLRRQQDDGEGKDVSAERELRDSRRRDGNRRDVRGSDHEERDFSMTNVADTLGKAAANQLRAAVPPAAPANNRGGDDDYAHTRCPLCGGKKGDPSFVLCRDHHGDYTAAADVHRAVISALGDEKIAKAIMDGTMDVATVQLPTEQAYALGLVLGAMDTYEKEEAAVDAAYQPTWDAISTRFDNTRTGIVGVDRINSKEVVREAVWAEKPGTKDLYFRLIGYRNRLKAARALVADCRRAGVTPGTMLTEPPTPA